VALDREFPRRGDCPARVPREHADRGQDDLALQVCVDAHRCHTSPTEFRQYRPLDCHRDARRRVVQYLVEVPGQVAVDCRHRECPLARRGDELGPVEPDIGYVVVEPAPGHARLRQTDGVVLPVDRAFESAALDFRERVEPLLDGPLVLASLRVLVLPGPVTGLAVVGFSRSVGFVFGLESRLVFPLEGWR